MTRRQLLAAATAAAGATLVRPARAADPDRFLSGQALYDHVLTYTGLGEHRTGTKGDLATSEWVRGVFEAAGLLAEKQPVPFRLFETEECYLEIGGTRLRTDPEYFPVATPPKGITAPLRRLAEGEPLAALAGSIWLTETTRYSMAVPRELRERAAAAGEAGALGVVIVVASRSGELLGRGAIPPAGDTDWSTVPIVAAAPKDALTIDAAAKAGTPVRLVVTGREQPDAVAYNVIGRWQGEGSKRIVVTTPQSGMFRCGGERGGGIALCLGLAQWVGARRPATSYLFSTNTGHEQWGRGMRRMQEEIAPKPEEVTAWLHLGSGIGSWDWRRNADDELEPYVRYPGSVRNFGSVPRFVPLLTEAFSHIEGLRPQSERFAGELAFYVEEGYPAFGFWGQNLFHHTVADGPEQTAPELLEPIAIGLRRALLAMEAG